MPRCFVDMGLCLLRPEWRHGLPCRTGTWSSVVVRWGSPRIFFLQIDRLPAPKVFSPPPVNRHARLTPLQWRPTRSTTTTRKMIWRTPGSCSVTEKFRLSRTWSRGRRTPFIAFRSAQFVPSCGKSDVVLQFGPRQSDARHRPRAEFRAASQS